MRFTKILFALISSLAFVTSLQIRAQTPAQPPVSVPQDDSALRDALRKALEGNTAPTAPVIPVAPAEVPVTPAPRVAPVAPVTPVAPTQLPPAPLTTYPYVVSNYTGGTTGVLAL